jgi:subtilisin family serine protease
VKLKLPIVASGAVVALVMSAVVVGNLNPSSPASTDLTGGSSAVEAPGNPPSDRPLTGKQPTSQESENRPADSDPNRALPASSRQSKKAGSSTTLLMTDKSGPKAGTPIAGSYVVILQDRAGLRSPAQINAAARRLSAKAGGRLSSVYTATLHGFSVKMSAQQATVMRGQGQVASVTQDTVVKALSTQISPSWNLDRVDQPGLPLSGTYDYATEAANVNIYMMDTGIRFTHSEFGGRVKNGPPLADNNDCEGHGTATAGAAAGSTWGVAKKATLYAVRVLGCAGGGAATNGLDAVEWVTKNAVHPAVVNASWGTGADDNLDTAIRNSIKSGITYVVAAGNSNNEDSCNDSPARVSEAIVVGASDSNDNRASFSSYGSCVDLFAPGTDIRTSAWDSDTATTSAGGTSLSAPIVTGAAAIYLANRPSATPAEVSAALIGCASTGLLGNLGAHTADRLLNIGCLDSSIVVTNPGRQSTTVGVPVHLARIRTIGSSSVQYTATGLPPGLSIDPATGVISGTPGATGTTTVTVTVTNGTASTSTSFIWDVIAAAITDKITINQPGSQSVPKNAPLWLKMIATSADTTQSVSFSANGLPAGLSINADTGVISGTPTSSGTSRVTITASDSNVSASASYLWQIADGPILGLNGVCADTGGPTVGSDKTAIMWVCNQASQQRWSVRDDGELEVLAKCMTPAAAATGSLVLMSDCSGAATQKWQPGSGGTLKNPATGLCLNAASSANRTQFTLETCNGSGHQVWTLPSTPAAVTHPGEQIFWFTGAVNLSMAADSAPRTYQASGLPAGLSIDSVTGKITGKPTTLGEGLAIVTATASSGTSGAAAFTWSVHTGPIVGPNGNCVDDYRGSPDDNNPIVVWQCNSGGTQIWNVGAQDTLELQHKCLTVANDATAAGSLIVLYNCRGVASQIWKQQKDGTLLNPVSGRCLAAPSLDVQTPFTLADCTAETGQQWRLPTTEDPILATGTITHSSGKWCLDQDGQGPWVWECFPTPEQTWSVNRDGRLISAANTGCLAALNGGTKPGTSVAIVACSVKDPTQFWHQKNGTLVNNASGRCLHASDVSLISRFTLETCTGVTNQQWTLPAAN